MRFVDARLGRTRVDDVTPLRRLTRLTHLYLGHTKVWSIAALAGLRHLDRVYWNLPSSALYEEAVFRAEGHICEQGPFVVNTGKWSARAAQDKFVVREHTTEDRAPHGAALDQVLPTRLDLGQVGCLLRTVASEDGTRGGRGCSGRGGSGRGSSGRGSSGRGSSGRGGSGRGGRAD